MWKPEFPYLEAHPALLRGYHRTLCVSSTVYRGTPEKPGLVMGLDRGGSCKGRAFLLAAKNVPDVMAYLHEREMSTNVYAPKFLNVRLNDGRTVKAYNFIVRRDHVQYTGKLSLNEAAAIVREGIGPMGTSLEYLESTLEHLDDMGIIEGPLHEICARAKTAK
ncbi:MAG: gamma-glutamylcyclotransferase, partial [Rhodospirillales bacterium]|nr:gamma-glutamylcyclotransferase [Rhodospirillales bacterium]